MAKSMLLISRQAPWSGPSAREALDIALAGGAFDLPLALLFLDDGVLQLCPTQQPALLQQKDLRYHKPWYGIHHDHVMPLMLLHMNIYHAYSG